MSTHNIEGKNFVKFNDEYVLDIQDQSTTTQFKQCSNANSTTSAFTENNCRSKPTKTQSIFEIYPKGSLLTLTPQISQRRGSQSLADQTMRYEDDSCVLNLYGKKSQYIIYWYDVNIDHKYEILIKTTKVQITIGDLIQLAISQFNEQNEYLQTPFSSDVNNQYLFELYIPKKKKGTPNEDFPSIYIVKLKGFADSTLLSQSNQTEFALKVSLKQSKYQTSLSNSKHSSAIKQNEKQVLGQKNSSSKKKNLFQQLFFFCNSAEDY
ncbi:unnamed protein product (macronuclear) [Paramecium tetraurelia]|uniref:Sin1 middle CRIM domain-containing protein n=1 Tax=Paramecium tetraurelia TaxID=5888 RepID=A0EHH4_PARTE|nr:uncharacterized protein GSPATT00027089001 [Paramecium tetraurelia]CAK94765.1 unnamed protein product [Paramecium tetraurelia]|eukprot:XP_001462138.1 hypothetical protein (macronuclear) [Paramecium tetraurelia strain d4-2]